MAHNDGAGPPAASGPRRSTETLAHLAHELKSPLTSIIGYASMLGRQIQRWSARHDERRQSAHDLVAALKVIQTQGDRMRKMIDDFLDLSRLEAGEISPAWEAVSCADLVRARADDPAVGERSLRIVADTPEPRARGDRDLLDWALAHVIDNALRFSLEDGAIDIGVRRADPYVALTVRDRGAGIAPGDLPHIFDRFYRGASTANARGDGLGVGLTIVRAIVDLHEGRIEVESAPGIGTTVTLCCLPPMPRGPDPAKPGKAHARRSLESPSRPKSPSRTDPVPRYLVVVQSTRTKTAYVRAFQKSGACGKMGGCLPGW